MCLSHPHILWLTLNIVQVNKIGINSTFVKFTISWNIKNA
jgi:hypothetical protein